MFVSLWYFGQAMTSIGRWAQKVHVCQSRTYLAASSSVWANHWKPQNSLGICWLGVKISAVIPSAKIWVFLSAYATNEHIWKWFSNYMFNIHHYPQLGYSLSMNCYSLICSYWVIIDHNYPYSHHDTLTIHYWRLIHCYGAIIFHYTFNIVQYSL